MYNIFQEFNVYSICVCVCVKIFMRYIKMVCWFTMRGNYTLYGNAKLYKKRWEELQTLEYIYINVYNIVGMGIIFNKLLRIKICGLGNYWSKNVSDIHHVIFLTFFLKMCITFSNVVKITGMRWYKFQLEFSSLVFFFLNKGVFKSPNRTRLIV